LRLALIDLELALARLPRLRAITRGALTAAAGHADPRVPHRALRCLARSGTLPPSAGPLPAGVLAVLPGNSSERAVVAGGWCQSVEGRIRQVVVAWAMSFPRLSVTLPSAVAVRRPAWMTVPSAVRVVPSVWAARM
jgi:hypothetical protein